MWQLFTFIILTALFFFVIVYKTNQSRCCPMGGPCYDGNGKYQYKGRGIKQESVEVLLSRIDWLAKNSSNEALYTTSFIIAFATMLAVIVILYAYTWYIVSVWEMILVLFASFILTFSILNLFDFHTKRYPQYYIRQNIEYIREKLDLDIGEPPDPSRKSQVPFRTEIRDILSK